jgi:mono/diheme cytochrome c family protein
MSRGLSALLLAALLSACGGEEKPAPTPLPAPAPAPVSPQPASAAVPHPDAAAPAGNLRGDPEAGKALYAQYCATCHGATGHGDGPVAATLNPKPANHADHVFMAGLTDPHLYQVISKGGASVGKSPMMAPWGGVINDQGIKDLIAYLRQLSST